MSKTKDIKNDIVFTPEYWAEFMCKLIEVGPGDVVLDNSCGAGNILKPVLKTGADAVGIEFNGEVYQELTEALKEGGFDSNKYQIACGDGLKLAEHNLKPWNKVVINPPYSFQGNGLIFGVEAAKNMNGGRMAILAPEQAGEKDGTKDEMLMNNTLIAVIKAPDLFKGYASTNTSVFVFECGRPHQKTDKIKFIDFSNDGYRRSGRKTQKGQVFEQDRPDERYCEILDIVLNNKEPEIYKDEVIVDTLAENKSWTFSGHHIIDTTPTIEDFKATVRNYLSWKISTVMNDGYDTNKK